MAIKTLATQRRAPPTDGALLLLRNLARLTAPAQGRSVYLGSGKRMEAAMHIVHVSVHVKADKIEEFKAASLDNAQHSVQEPGVARGPARTAILVGFD